LSHPLFGDDMILDEGIIACIDEQRRMITWTESVLPVVGVVHCSYCWCLGCNTFMRLVLRTIEVLVTGHGGFCVGLWMFSLASRDCCVVLSG
jgi:hypothetical protein